MCALRARLFQKVLKWTAVVLAALFAAMQFVRPARTNPPVDESRVIGAHLSVTPEVAAILDRSCNDCHSNLTRWPWYSNFAPVSWFVIDHVNEGRSEMNFSDWAQYPTRQQGGLLKEICKEVKHGSMPLSSYLTMHGDARLSDADVKVLCDWASAESQRIAESR